MEREANYALVGTISIVLLIAVFVFVIWLANFQFNQKFDRYRVIFRGPVSGLTKGGEVQFNGIQVGEITKIELDTADASRVLTDIELQHHTPVRTDSYAQTFAKGITGVKYIQISSGSPQKPLLRDVSREDRPVIAAKRGRMEDFVEDISKLASSGGEVLRRLNRILSDGNIEGLSFAIANVRDVTGEMSQRKTMFARLDSTMAKLDKAAGDFQTTMAGARGALGNDESGLFSQIGQTAVELRLAVANLKSLTGKVDGVVDDMSTSTLPRVTLAMASVEKAAERLDGLAFKLEQNPGMLLRNQPDRQVEIPQ